MPIQSEKTNDSGNLESLVADLVAHEPTVNEQIVAEIERKVLSCEEMNGAPANAVPVSSTDNGVGVQPSQVSEKFDPAIHERNEDGTPRLTKDGRFRRKRGPSNKRSNTGVVNESVTTGGAVPVDYRGLAVFCCTVAFSGFETAFGNAWKPSDSERENITKYTEAYARHKQWNDVPPGMALLIAVGMYAAPRIMNDEETKRRLRAIGEKLGFVKRDIVAVQEKTPEPDKPRFVDPMPHPLSQFHVNGR